MKRSNKKVQMALKAEQEQQDLNLQARLKNRKLGDRLENAREEEPKTGRSNDAPMIQKSVKKNDVNKI